MSAPHYNRVMMRQLRDPLLDLLTSIADACGQVSRGERLPEAVTEAESARHMTDSLKMVGCPALGRLSQALGQALEGLANAPARGWSDEHARLVAGDAMALAQDFSPVLQRLAEGGEILPVALWPRWSQLLSRMNVSVPPARELFEPVAQFDDLNFERLDPEYLAEVVTGATARLERATTQMNAALEEGQVSAFAQALAQIQEVFDWADRTHHRRGFQPYWLIVRARLSEARLNAARHLADPESIRQLIRHGNLELQRFGADARRVGQERLLGDIIPLLEPWSESLQQNPVLTDLRERFNLDGFWAAVNQATEKKADPAGQEFEHTMAALIGLLDRVEESWVRWSSSGGDVRDVVRAFAALVLRSADLPTREARELLQAIQVALEWCAKRPGEQDDVVNGEVAGGLVALEDTLQGPAVLTPGLADRLRQQTRRLRAVMVPGRVEYQQLPTIRWDTQRMRQEALGARKKAFEQVIKDLNGIEGGLEDIMREEVDPKDHRVLLTNMVAPLEVGAAVLGLLRLPLHARLTGALAQRLERLAVRPVLLEDEAERQVLAEALPALIGSLQGHMDGRGQDDDDDLLAHASAVLLNETLTGVRQSPDWEMAAPVAMAPQSPSVLQAETVSESADQVPPLIETEPVALEPVAVSENLVSLSPPPPTAGDVQSQLLSEEGYEDTLERADPEIAEGFFLEGPEKLANLSGWRHALLDQPDDADAWDEVRRSFHTLKGSGRFVYLTGLTEVAWWMEKFISDQIKSGQPYTPRVDAVVELASRWFSAAFESLQTHGRLRVDGRPIWSAIHDAPIAGTSPESVESIETVEPVQVALPASLAATSALSRWSQDPEGAAAIQEDLRRRRADLADALADEDPELLERAAHTLRTLANILALPQWEKECAAVESHLGQGHPVSMEAVVDRWMQVIDDLENENDPAETLRVPLTLVGSSPAVPAPIAPEDEGEEPFIIEPPVLDFASPEFDEPEINPPIEAETEVEVESETAASLTSDLGLNSVHEVELTVETDEVQPVADANEIQKPSIEMEIPVEPSQEAVPATPVETTDPRSSARVRRDAIWDEVFASLDMMMEGGRRLGEALVVMRQSEAAEDEDAGDDPA